MKIATDLLVLSWTMTISTDLYVSADYEDSRQPLFWARTIKIAADLCCERGLWRYLLNSILSADLWKYPPTSNFKRGPMKISSDLHLARSYEDGLWPLMTIFYVQTKWFCFVYQPIFFYSSPPTPCVPYISQVPNNPWSHQPTYVSVLTAPLSVLGMCGVGCITIASAITPIYSPLSVLYTCPPILSFSYPVSLSSTAPIVLLLNLSPFSEISPLLATLPLLIVISCLISWPEVVEKVDVVRSCLPSEGCVWAEAVAGSFPFGVEPYEHFSAIWSIWARYAVSVCLTGKLPELFHHPKTWFHVRVPLLLLVYFLSRVFSPWAAPSCTVASLQYPLPIVILSRHLYPGGGGVIHSPLSNRLCSSPNSARAPISTSFRDVVLQLWRKTWTCLWIQSTMSALKRRCPAKAFSYWRSKR